MKKITVKQLTLLNFKGIRNLTADFNARETIISGRNGSGKSTIFDAFTWLLFGKDSHDRKDFNVKTLDAANNAFPKLPHEVTGTLSVNGEDVKLKKTYKENWVKKRGSAEETFQGHKLECYVNDVPCNVSEYNRKVAEICEEQVFKYITNPLYFCTQKPEVQRAMLFRMAGNISDDEIAAGNDDFKALLANLTGKTLEEYKKEIAAKKRIIREAVENIPARIDERKRDMPEPLNWVKLESEIKGYESEVDAIDKQMSDVSAAYEAMTKGKQELARQLSETKLQITQREYSLREEIEKEYRSKMQEYERKISVCNDQNEKLARLQRDLRKAETELSDLQAKREELIREWHDIKAEQINIDEDNFVCPTCHRPLEPEDIEAKSEQMIADFNAHKAQRLENNKACGMRTKADIEAKQAEIENIKAEISKWENATTLTISVSDKPLRPEDEPILAADRVLADLQNKATDLQNQINAQPAPPETNDLRAQRAALEEKIHSAKMQLATRELIASANKRISELEKEYSESQNKLAGLERIEFTIQQFSKARTEAVEKRINGLFQLVKFKLFEQQINGGEIETCEATVNGVPFSDLNSAMKIHAGIDIINAICKFEGVSAPVFIDNAESLNTVQPTDSQLVLLKVTDEELYIDNNVQHNLFN